MNRNKTFIIAVIIPVLILLSLLTKPALTMFLGEEIMLETVAYDPTDLFRGDYVAINLKISEIKSDLLSVSPEQLKNNTIYVQLKKQGKYHSVFQVSTEKPLEGIYLKGKIPPYELNDPNISVFHVDYGLDKFFLKQGTGLKLQEASYKGTLSATVKIYKGYALLTEIGPSNIDVVR